MWDATPLLRIYARRRLSRLARQDAAAVQEQTLLRLVRHARDTRFGRDHDFGGIADVADFQARVPLRRYEAMWEEYWREDFPRLVDVSWPGPMPYFAVTSGTTTGRTKNIPCSREMVRANRRAATDVLVHHLQARPTSRVFGGCNFVLGGSTDLVEVAAGVHSGDLSGIQAANVPAWARRRYFPPPDLALLADWEEKVTKLVAASVAADIRSISGTPSWLLIFFDRLFAAENVASHRLADVYPDLELLVHGGLNFAPYRHRFAALLAGGGAELREAYPASEGFFAVADAGADDGLRLILDNGLFYEFVPAEALDTDAPRRHWLADVQTGVNYAIVVSSCAGLWSYVVGDTVRFVARDPPRVVVTGRTAYSLSAFGEHLIEEEIEAAVGAAAMAIGADVRDFAVGPLFPQEPGEPGRHLYIIEFDGEGPGANRIAAFAKALDARLCEENEDYEAHRADGFGMEAPDIRVVPAGTFAAWMAARGKLGGQHKVPRVINDPKLLAELRAFVG